MLYFENDYSEGAYEDVLKRLIETNMEQLPGYGTDRYTLSAKEKICAACGCPDAEVYLLTGGTQTNQIVISSMLDSHEGVIAAETGHVGTHEAGAIEWTGHKVLTLPQADGKISAADLEEYLVTFYGDDNHEHMVFREWSIFLILQSMALCIQKENWQNCLRYAVNTGFLFIWTEPGSGMHWLQRIRM